MNATTQSSSQFAGPLGAIGAQEGVAGLPILQQLSSQIQQALRTGGIGAQQPIINTAQDAARQAFSTAQTDTAESLARRNIGGSQAENILGNQRMAGGAQIAGIGPGIAQGMIGQAPGVALGALGGGASALGGAGSLSRTSSYAPSFWDAFSQALQTGEGFSSGVGDLSSSPAGGWLASLFGGQNPAAALSATGGGWV